MRFSRLLATTFVLAASTFIAHADTISYTYSVGPASSTGIAATITFDEPFLLTTDTVINTADFLGSNNSSVVAFEINPATEHCVAAHAGTNHVGSCVAIFYAGNSVYDTPTTTLLNKTGSFVLFGGTLTITDVPSSPAVPEPSSIALLGTGILGFAGVVRRKFLSQS